MFFNPGIVDKLMKKNPKYEISMTLTLEIPRSASHAEYQGVIKLITQEKNYCVTPN
jgi:hypothetical protein